MNFINYILLFFPDDYFWRLVLDDLICFYIFMYAYLYKPGFEHIFNNVL